MEVCGCVLPSNSKITGEPFPFFMQIMLEESGGGALTSRCSPPSVPFSIYLAICPSYSCEDASIPLSPFCLFCTKDYTHETTTVDVFMSLICEFTFKFYHVRAHSNKFLEMMYNSDENDG